MLRENILVDPLGFAEGGAGVALNAPMRTVDGATDGCGENNYDGGPVNELVFFLTPAEDCVLSVRPRTIIQLGVRLDFPTIADFFATGG